MIKFNKDRWIADAIMRGYIVVKQDGSILRCKRADKIGNVFKDKGYDLVKPQIHKKSGRVYFNMVWRGITKSVLVNRVVAIRFLKNPGNLAQVNHIDGDKENNALSNLEWCSSSDNERHAHKTGLKSGRGSSNSNAKLTAECVVAIRESQEDLQVLADRYGVSRSTIYNITQNKTWRHL